MTEGAVEGPFSEVADQQLDAIEASDPELLDDVLAACELVFTNPGRAQGMSSAIQTSGGIRVRLPVSDRAPYKVFWSADGDDGHPRIEAVFPHP